MSNNRLIKSEGSIRDDFGMLEVDKVYHYVNFGQWSIHELLAHLLEFTGPADVMVSSYSLSETAIRSFVHLLDGGKILSLKCLFDVSTKKNKLGLLMFAGNVASKVYISPNHAKLISIKNDNITVIVNTSANLTTNRRNEAGCIITDQFLASSFQLAITELFEHAIELS